MTFQIPSILPFVFLLFLNNFVYSLLYCTFALVLLILAEVHLFQVFQQKLDESQTETSIARQLVEIYSKINKELKEAVEISFTGKKLVNYVPIREIVITTEIESLNKEIDKSLNVRSLEPVSLEDKEDKKKLIL